MIHMYLLKECRKKDKHNVSRKLLLQDLLWNVLLISHCIGSCGCGHVCVSKKTRNKCSWKSPEEQIWGCVDYFIRLWLLLIPSVFLLFKQDFSFLFTDMCAPKILLLKEMQWIMFYRSLPHLLKIFSSLWLCISMRCLRTC